MSVGLFSLGTCFGIGLSFLQNTPVFDKILTGELDGCDIFLIPCVWEFWKTFFSLHKQREPVPSFLKKYLRLFRSKEFLTLIFFSFIRLRFIRVSTPEDFRIDD